MGDENAAKLQDECQKSRRKDEGASISTCYAPRQAYAPTSVEADSTGVLCQNAPLPCVRTVKPTAMESGGASKSPRYY
jgi:hypothetical protein